MANTIVQSAIIRLLREGGVSEEPLLVAANKRITQTGMGMAAGPQLITTAAVNLNLGNLTTIGYGWFLNLDPTNYLELGWDNAGFVHALKLMPGVLYPGIPLHPGRTWQGRANTANCWLDYLVLDL